MVKQIVELLDLPDEILRIILKNLRNVHIMYLLEGVNKRLDVMAVSVSNSRSIPLAKCLYIVMSLQCMMQYSIEFVLTYYLEFVTISKYSVLTHQLWNGFFSLTNTLIYSILLLQTFVQKQLYNI